MSESRNMVHIVLILSLTKFVAITFCSSFRNAHSKTAEKLDTKVGQWIFLAYYENTISEKYLLNENTISEKYTHYVDILKHVKI